MKDNGAAGGEGGEEVRWSEGRAQISWKSNAFSPVVEGPGGESEDQREAGGKCEV